MITSPESTREQRLERIRHLSDLAGSGNTTIYPDTDITSKIEAVGDVYARQVMGGLPTDPDRLNLAVYISNLQTAFVVLTGIGGDKQRATAEMLRKERDSAVAVANNRGETQYEPDVFTTAPSEGRTFS